MHPTDLPTIAPGPGSRHRIRRFHGVCAALSMLLVTPGFGDTFVVDTLTDAVDISPGDGFCDDGGGDCTLRAAVMESNALAGPDTILLGEDIHLLEILVCGDEVGQSLAQTYDDSCGDLDVTSEITVRGVGGYRSMVDASTLAGGSNEFNSGHFHVSSAGTLRLEDLMLRDASQRGEGGAIDNDGGTVHVTRSVLYGNSATFRGGAIASTDGIVTVEHSLIVENDCPSGIGGGGIFHGNSSDPGAGNHSLILRNSTVAENGARFDSGATSDGRGGGLYLGTNSRTLLDQATVASNDARGQGGGIYFSGVAGAELLGSSVVLNRADHDDDAKGSRNGGGLFHNAGAAALVSTRNTLIADNLDSGDETFNRSPDCNGAFEMDYSLIGNTEGCTITGADNQFGDADLEAFGDRGGLVPTVGFAFTSDAVDAGDSSSCPATDARGMPRSVGSGCDIGAWESGNPVSFLPKISGDGPDLNPGNGVCATVVAGLPALQVCSLRAAVSEAVGLADVVSVATSIELEAFDYTVGGGMAGDDGEDDGEIGDLDVFDRAQITIEGAGARLSRIVGTGFDRLFHVFDTQLASLTLRDLALVGGAAQGAASGGNLLVTGTASATLEQVLVTGGTGTHGAGLAAFSGATLIVRRSTIEGNDASGRGGGIYGNGDHLEVVNSTIHDNDADQDGGGIAIASGGYELNFVTVTGNDADADRSGDDGDGGGVFFAEVETGTVQGSVIALNRDATSALDLSAADCSGITDSTGFNLVGRHNACGFTSTGDLTGTSNSPLDPQLGPLEDNGGPTDTRLPLTGSPLVDAGPSTSLPPTDQRGVSRLADGDGQNGAEADIGAAELASESIFNDGFESGNTNAWM